MGPPRGCGDRSLISKLARRARGLASLRNLRRRGLDLRGFERLSCGHHLRCLLRAIIAQSGFSVGAKQAGGGAREWGNSASPPRLRGPNACLLGPPVASGLCPPSDGGRFAGATGTATNGALTFCPHCEEWTKRADWAPTRRREALTRSDLHALPLILERHAGLIGVVLAAVPHALTRGGGVQRVGRGRGKVNPRGIGHERTRRLPGRSVTVNDNVFEPAVRGALSGNPSFQ